MTRNFGFDDGRPEKSRGTIKIEGATCAFFLRTEAATHIKQYPYQLHPMEMYHNPKLFTTTMDPVVDKTTDTKRPVSKFTPDFRLTEPLPEPLKHYPIQTHRPYRVSPFYKQTYYFPGKDVAAMYGCYCTTVFKRYRLLAGCAVITTRHILTTATSTELVLRKYRKFRSLENILGFWYDIGKNVFNSSMYGTPSRIHYHPLYTMPKYVNRTHPFPVMFDLSVWAATYTFDYWRDVKVCNRAGPHKWDHAPGTPSEPCYYNIFGFQFMRAYSRRPQPWYKYTVRVLAENAVIPCPKTEWGWYHCFNTETWAPLGVDHGAALHRHCPTLYRYDGLAAMNVLNMKLRSVQMLSYFIDLNNHAVLNFLYDAYNGRIPCVYLDIRFHDTLHAAPKPREGFKIPHRYPYPEQHYSDVTSFFPEAYLPGFRN